MRRAPSPVTTVPLAPAEVTGGSFKREATVEIFLIQASDGHWEVRDGEGLIHGEFEERSEAIRYGELEASKRPPATLLVHDSRDHLEYGTQFRMLRGTMVRRHVPSGVLIAGMDTPAPFTSSLARRPHKTH
jgi:hypothetical protein